MKGSARGGGVNGSPAAFPGSVPGTERCCLACSTVTGIVLIILGGCAWLMLGPVLYNGIQAQNFVTDASSPGYTTFATSWTGSEDDVPQYEYFWFYNLTNAALVQGATAKPIYEEVGPIAYRVNTTKLNIAFSADGTLVSFQRQKVYQYQSTLSNLLPSAPIININPAYVASVQLTGGENNLNFVMGSVALVNRVLYDIERVYVNGTLGAGAGNYDTLLQQCQAIDPACSSTSDMALVQWGYYNLTGPRFGLFNQPMNVNQSATFPNATELFFTGQSLFSRLNGSFPIGIQAARKLLFTPGTGLFANPPAFAQLSSLCLNNQAGPVFQTWGISLQQCAVYVGYITGQIAATYTDSFMVNTVFAQQQGGLFVNRPAAAVLFGARDGLLSYLTPASPFVAYFKNATTEAPGFTTMHTGKDDVAQVGNLTQWNNRTTFAWPGGVAEVQGNFGNQFPPATYTGTGQRLPTSPLPDLPIWSSNHGRAIVFKDTNDVVDILTVKTNKFALDTNTYSANPLYALQPGFEGFVNATFMNNGTPLYYCQPHFYLVNSIWAARVQGVREASADVDNSFVWLEPITGLAFSANVSLQINVFLVTSAALWNRYSLRAMTNVMYPAVYTVQSTTGTQIQADKINESVYKRVLLIKTLFAVLIGIGSILLLSVSLWIANEVRRSKVGYSEL